MGGSASNGPGTEAVGCGEGSGGGGGGARIEWSWCGGGGGGRGGRWRCCCCCCCCCPCPCCPCCCCSGSHPPATAWPWGCRSAAQAALVISHTLTSVRPAAGCYQVRVPRQRSCQAVCGAASTTLSTVKRQHQAAARCVETPRRRHGWQCHGCHRNTGILICIVASACHALPCPALPCSSLRFARPGGPLLPTSCVPTQIAPSPCLSSSGSSSSSSPARAPTPVTRVNPHPF
jgi:hypothetical protein